MKKFLLLLFILLFTFPISISAKSSYVSLSPYPYFTHVIGEDLVIYGDTDYPNVTLGLYYPNDEQGYKGFSKYIITISGEEFRKGHVIKTGPFSRLWPEGEWKIVVQNGQARDEMHILMKKERLSEHHMRIAEYSDGILSSIKTYTPKGLEYRNNVLRIHLNDETEIRIFSWRNLAPVNSGTARLFLATYKDGYMTSVKTFSGELIDYGKHITLNLSKTERLEIFFWSDNLIPIM